MPYSYLIYTVYRHHYTRALKERQSLFVFVYFLVSFQFADNDDEGTTYLYENIIKMKKQKWFQNFFISFEKEKRNKKNRKKRGRYSTRTVGRLRLLTSVKM